MPKVSFPHMGEYSRSFEMLLQDLGNEVVLPPRPTKRTLDYGVQNAPEFACFPLKIIMGTYIEVCKMGVDYIVSSGGVGPCRAGQYVQMHQNILKELGFKTQMITLEAPRFQLMDFLQKVQMINPLNLSYKAIWECVMRAWKKISILDTIEQATHKIRPRELIKGSTTKAYKKVLNWISSAYTNREMDEAKDAALFELKKVDQVYRNDILKIGLIGEIYVLLEPASNLEIEEILGSLGVEVHRSMYLTGWTQDNTGGKGTKEHLSVKEAAAPYIPLCIGGHGQESVGHTVIYAKEGYDGVIQLAPFTCIPELVSRTVLTKLSQDLNIPILTFFLDEQTGKAGMTTRLEAFVDLIRRQKLDLQERSKK